MQSVTDPCSRKYTAVHDSGARPTTGLKRIVLHCTEGSTATGAAAWFTYKASGGSAHLVVDDTICYRTLEDGRVPWGAYGANTDGLHIEQAGYAKWTTAEWKRHDFTIRRAAYHTAVWSVRYGIPLRWVGPVRLRLGWKGVTTHAWVCKAFKPPNGDVHTDPGKNYPTKLFMDYAKMYAKQLSQT